MPEFAYSIHRGTVMTCELRHHLAPCIGLYYHYDGWTVCLLGLLNALFPVWGEWTFGPHCIIMTVQVVAITFTLYRINTIFLAKEFRKLDHIFAEIILVYQL